MNRKERVLDLFEFLMTLIEEPQTQELPQETAPVIEDVITVNEPAQEVADPSRILDIMKRIDELDKEKTSRFKVDTAVRHATKILSDELERMRTEHVKSFEDDKVMEEKALESTNTEEREKPSEAAVQVKNTLKSFFDNSGLTLNEKGEYVIVPAPTELRDNIPLTDDEQISNFGMHLSKDENKEINN